MGIALWLAPPASESESFSSVITSLSKQYATPPFAPHVTLLTGIPTSASTTELLDSVRSAVKGIAPFQVTLTKLGSKADQNNYFQYLFSIVETPNKELFNLRKVVRTALLPPAVSETLDDYFPHLSLAYGIDNEERNAAKMIRDLENSALPSVKEFKVVSVQVVMCEGKPEEWKVLGEAPLES
ncbi:LigT-like protein [Meredithblackwellia eburnea MCA 4105]